MRELVVRADADVVGVISWDERSPLDAMAEALHNLVVAKEAGSSPADVLLQAQRPEERLLLLCVIEGQSGKRGCGCTVAFDWVRFSPIRKTFTTPHPRHCAGLTATLMPVPGPERRRRFAALCDNLLANGVGLLGDNARFPACTTPVLHCRWNRLQEHVFMPSVCVCVGGVWVGL